MASVGITGRLGGIWRSYEHLLGKHPLPVQVATSAALWSAGDLLSQRISGNTRWDRRQTLSTAAYAAGVVGPVGHFWYLGLDSVARRLFTSGSIPFIGAKLFADTFVYGPFHVAGFFALLTLADGGTWTDVKAKLKNDFVTTFTAEMGFWVPFQAFNFWTVPVQHQLLAVNLATLLDATFLCWVRMHDDWTSVLFGKQKEEGSKDGKGRSTEQKKRA